MYTCIDIISDLLASKAKLYLKSYQRLWEIDDERWWLDRIVSVESYSIHIWKKKNAH